MKTIDVKRLAEKAASGEVDLIDVRTPVEYRAVHAEYAKNFPLDALNPQTIAARSERRPDEPLYVICQSGSRSSKGVQKFLDAGVEHVINVEGGTSAWVAAGLPVIRGKKAISLERQVRIAAGFLVLLGALLGYFVHPYFIGLSGIVGAGLMFAGITDTCGMGMMLAKMPWNRCEDGGSCSV